MGVNEGDGRYQSFTGNVSVMFIRMLKRCSSKMFLRSLARVVPQVLLVNYWLEVAFAERWFRVLRDRKGFADRGASLSPGEASS